jgi:tetratricopeptide (TPR) repeat protein
MSDDWIEPLLQQAIAHHQAGHFAEAEAIYRRVLARQPKQANALHYLGVLAGQAGEHQAAIDLIRRAVSLHPQDREAQLNLANTLALYAISLHNVGKSDQAIPLLREALSMEPENAQTRLNLALALNNYGNVLRERGAVDEALSALREAQSLRPDLAQVRNNLASALRDNYQLDEAILEYRQAIALDPRYAQAWNNLGVALREKLQIQEAIDAHRRAIAIQPSYADAHFALGWALLLTGNFVEGWKEYEWRLRQKNASLLERTWDGAELNGKTILLHAEQGFGDTIQYARFIPRVAQGGGKIILACQSELVRLLKNLPGVDRVVSNAEALPPFDVRCPLMSLPLVFATEASTILANIPYLTPDADDVARWSKRLKPGQRLRVGVSWSGRPTHPDDRNRSIPLHDFRPLFQHSEIEIHSLQPSAGQGADMGLIEYGDALKDFADTAALIGNLDLIISVDTAVAHLAGAMGKPVWLLLPYSPDWRWMLNHSDSPWYPTMRLFRQSRLRDWVSVVNQVAQQLSITASRHKTDAVRRG